MLWAGLHTLWHLQYMYMCMHEQELVIFLYCLLHGLRFKVLLPSEVINGDAESEIRSPTMLTAKQQILKKSGRLFMTDTEQIRTNRLG